MGRRDLGTCIGGVGLVSPGSARGGVFAKGLVEFWSVIGIGFGILASWTFIAIPLRRESARLGALTLPDYFELRFNDRTRVPADRVDGLDPRFLHGVRCRPIPRRRQDPQRDVRDRAVARHSHRRRRRRAYTLLGGFLAVAWTDVIQGLLMTSVAVVLARRGHHPSRWL